MSRIVISTQGGIHNRALVAAVRSITHDSVSHVATMLQQGGPLFDGDLFARPCEEQFAKIRKLLNVLMAAKIEPTVLESGQPISREILQNIMQSSEESIAHFEQLGNLGHEA